MKKPIIDYMHRNPNDKFYTPEIAIRPLVKYIPDNIKTIYECNDNGNSNITKLLVKYGYNVVSTHIETGFDFLRDDPYFEYDCIITNPPYSIKDDFLERCYILGKPFALLMPLTALEGKRRNELYRKYGISVIILDSRINFMDNKKSPCFTMAWFVWCFDDGNRLYFENVLVY